MGRYTRPSCNMTFAATPLKLLLGAAGIAGGVFLFQHAISHALHIVIESEAKPMKIEAAPIATWQGCGIDLTWKSSPPPRHRCDVQLVPPPKSAPMQTITKGQSEDASLWFMVAAFAFPLSLGAAGLIAFLLFRTVRAAEQLRKKGPNRPLHIPASSKTSGSSD
jgi:hypothetical protein